MGPPLVRHLILHPRPIHSPYEVQQETAMRTRHSRSTSARPAGSASLRTMRSVTPKKLVPADTPNGEGERPRSTPAIMDADRSLPKADGVPEALGPPVPKRTTTPEQALVPWMPVTTRIPNGPAPSTWTPPEDHNSPFRGVRPGMLE